LPPPVAFNRYLQEFFTLQPVDDLCGVYYCCTDFFGLWQKLDQIDPSTPAPFWATHWPAARVLSSFLQCTLPARLRTGPILDFACGSGLVATTCARLGCEVLANDISPFALQMARANSRANGCTLRTDSNDYTQRGFTDFSALLCADFFYEKQLSLKMWELVLKASKRGVCIILADSGRPFFPPEKDLPGFSLIEQKTVAVSGEIEESTSRCVRLYCNQRL